MLCDRFARKYMKKMPLALTRYVLLASKGVAIGAVAGLAAASAWADSKGPVVPPLAKYQTECAACHIAYQPGMLPAPSWKRLMGSLAKHYGTDATLDEASVREISQWLQVNAGTYKRVREEPPQDRITKSAWFIRKHDEVDPAIWKQAAVKSASNCIACHTQADKGRFSEHEIAFPKGLDARFRRNWSD
jgi:mono/diheme cytochrome c family protein